MFKLPPLQYDFDALKKWISAETMRAHHDFHHKIYVEKLNSALEILPREIYEKYFGKYFEKDENSVENLANSRENLARFLNDICAGKLDEKIDEKLRENLVNFGGGHLNHSLFWKFLSPKSDGAPTGILARKIDEKFGNFENFTREFEKSANGIFGSGWAWLNADLEIETSANQNRAKNPAILSLDVWEHAYYLDFQWRRADYLAGFWDFVNWDFARERFEKFAEI